MTADPAPRTAVAYLVSHYPALSHAFIEREVAALREAGVRVETFSVRPSLAGDQRSAFARAEGARTTTLLGRGAATYLRAQARLLARSPRAWSAGVRRALRSGPPGARATVWQLFYLVEASVLQREMSERGLRHVHVHFANGAADVARLVVELGRALDGPSAGWRWSFSMHGPTEFTDPVGHDLAAKVRSAASVACISEFCRQELLALVEPEQAPDLSIVRMTVDAAAYPGRAADRAAREPGPLRLLFVGRLVPEKGPGDLLRAVDRLVRAGTDVVVRIAGTGPLEDELRRAASAAGLDDVVTFLGGVGQDDLPAQYAWADVFCLPSYAEGVPAVLMEAMSSELPVLTTRIAGIPELVVPGTGVLVEAGDVTALVDAVGRLAADPQERARLGRAGRDRVLEEFGREANVRRLLDTWGAGPATVDVREGQPTRARG